MKRLPSEIADCYYVLGLPRHASLEEVKSAYRKLVKRYHPDYNPGDRRATEQFIRIRQAYETLIAVIEPLSSPPDRASQSTTDFSPSAVARPPANVKIYVKKRHEASAAPHLSPEQKRIKQQCLDQIDLMLRQWRWQQAARQAEELARRFPRDPDVGRVQAKAYLGWARDLLNRRQYDAARPFLQKAMSADPTNQALWEEIERDYVRIERGLRL